MHGKIHHIDEVVFDSPPLHDNCRCSIVEMESIRAGIATKNVRDGADYWLKYYGELPDYYIGRRNGHRVLWSSDGLMFVTYDHYHTFYEII